MQTTWVCLKFTKLQDFYFGLIFVLSGRSLYVVSLRTCRVLKGTGSQSVVVCGAKYPGSESWQQVLWRLAKAVRYAPSYWLSGALCIPGLAILRVYAMRLGYSKAVFILLKHEWIYISLCGEWSCWTKQKIIYCFRKLLQMNITNKKSKSSFVFFFSQHCFDLVSLIEF